MVNAFGFSTDKTAHRCAFGSGVGQSVVDSNDGRWLVVERQMPRLAGTDGTLPERPHGARAVQRVVLLTAGRQLRVERSDKTFELVDACRCGRRVSQSAGSQLVELPTSTHSLMRSRWAYVLVELHYSRVAVSATSVEREKRIDSQSSASLTSSRQILLDPSPRSWPAASRRQAWKCRRRSLPQAHGSYPAARCRLFRRR